ncbi:MAG: AbrB/MazE/SpoVT family DNA-binding domain-containing protein [Terriglobales bacterium]|jgi:AbrB family looped-hinge helix DNA binding protein|nr:AbrB/MazE/SpoVT family DNA-binding domain-containing protein [Terriglobales bacterium]
MATHDGTLQYLTTTKIGEKGQLTIPKEFRQDLELGAGAPFAVLRLGNGLILLPEQRRFEDLCNQIGETLVGAGFDAEALIAALPEARRRVFARRYGKKSSSAKGHRRKTRVSRGQ